MRFGRQDMAIAMRRLGEIYEKRREIAEQSVVLRAADTCLREMGGVEAFGKFMAETFLLADQSQSLTSRREIMGAFKDWFKEYDEINSKAFDLSSIDEEELRAVVVASVLDRIDEEKDFAAALLYKVADKLAADDPDKLAEIISNLQSLRNEAVPCLTSEEDSDE